MYHIFFIQSYINGHLGCFHVLTFKQCCKEHRGQCILLEHVFLCIHHQWTRSREFGNTMTSFATGVALVNLETIWGLDEPFNRHVLPDIRTWAISFLGLVRFPRRIFLPPFSMLEASYNILSSGQRGRLRISALVWRLSFSFEAPGASWPRAPTSPKLNFQESARGDSLGACLFPK